MVSISIELTEDDAARLTARASALAIAPEQLAAAVLHDELNAEDEQFEALAQRIVDKNRELCARLA
jgi:hypothetical protein